MVTARLLPTAKHFAQSSKVVNGDGVLLGMLMVAVWNGSVVDALMSKYCNVIFAPVEG